MIYNMDNVTNSRCRELLERLEPLVFTNYQLIYKFADDCDDDIKRLRCGRTDEDGDKVHILCDFVLRLNFSFNSVLNHNSINMQKYCVWYSADWF